MVRPSDLIPSDLRDRLDAAREHLHITVEWIERGDPRCRGRDFGFWRVQVGLDGWHHRPPVEYAYGKPCAPEDRGPASVEGVDLSRVITRALDLAKA